jgi:hypothetical protein
MSNVLPSGRRTVTLLMDDGFHELNLERPLVGLSGTRVDLLAQC